MDLSVSDASVGRLLDGRYRVDALLARGGMATVYKATDTRLDRAVALKVMHAELAADDEFVARFIGEARAVARLSNPHVVNVFDQGEDDGAVFLAMEFIDGRTLRDVLAERGRLSAELALEVAESVLTALAAAHAAGIVHRDVKPENVLVGNDGRVRVADFGLARATSSSAKTTRGLLGTVSYISPEQALGERATPRSDVYSTGIMLYELLTGRTPHSGPTDFVVVRSHIDDDVPPPSESVPLPRVVDDLVLTATSRAADERYADAGQFLAAVRIARASIGSLADIGDLTDDLTGIGEIDDIHAESRDTAGVTLEEALAGTVLAEQLDLAEQPPAHRSGSQAGPVASESSATRVIDTPPVPPPPPATEPGSGGGKRAAARAAASQRTGSSRSRRGIVMFLLVLLLAVGVAGGAWWYGSGRWGTTPSLLNMTPEAAQSAALESGFTAVQDGEEFSETVEAGHVLGTEPGPGEQILKGDEIAFVVSKGPERYEVPTLTGMAVDAATKALTEVSLTVRVADEVYHDTVAAGLVISQAVEPGEQLRRGAEVPIVVSLGRQPIEIKDFTGQAATDAQAALTKAGFKVTTDGQVSDSVAAGLVISQDPASGTGFKGAEIHLVVSEGPEMVDVPEVVGKKVDDAERIVREAGFEVEVIDMIQDFRNRGPDRVIRVEPDGSQPRGTTIRLYHF